MAPNPQQSDPEPGALRAPVRLPALDGLRGIAIILVLVYHYSLLSNGATSVDRAFLNVTAFGASGVTLFFVLSGFLITNILLDGKAHTNYFRVFYARRFLRIAPLFYVLLAFALLVVPRIPGWKIDGSGIGNDGLWYALYLSNFSIAAHPEWRHATLDVTWSLAIEEQFYLVWPAVVLLCSMRRLASVCVALIASALVWRFFEYVMSLPSTFDALPPGHFDGLATGALIAMAVRVPSAFGALTSRLAHLQVGAAITLILLVAWPESTVKPLIGSILVLLFAATLARVLAPAEAQRARRWLESPWLRAFGIYSYAIYLFHQPVGQLVARLVPIGQIPTVLGSNLPAVLAHGVVSGIVVFALGWLSWRLFERRVLGLKRYFEYGPLGNAVPGRRRDPTPDTTPSVATS
jgi:peptidoglycan/LPS O-acetylase OafA/YrhL